MLPVGNVWMRASRACVCGQGRQIRRRESKRDATSRCGCSLLKAHTFLTTHHSHHRYTQHKDKDKRSTTMLVAESSF